MQWKCANQGASLLLGCAFREKSRLEMTSYPWFAAAPADKENVRCPWSAGITSWFRLDGHAVGQAIASLERSGPVVHGHVSAQGALITLGVVGWKMTPAHRPPETISRITLAAMNARLAGRSARRRMRYGYHCVPNGTYTRMR